MASIRQIRGRLRSISSTKQIMRAMQLVSASKLKRAQGRLLQARSTLEFLDGLLQRVLAATASERNQTAGRSKRRGTTAPASAHPLCAANDEASPMLVLFTSDAGLCGSYNTNLIQLTESYLRQDGRKPVHMAYIGKKGHRYFTKRGYAAAEAYVDLAGRPDVAKAESIGRALMDRFLAGHVSSVNLIYSEFKSSMVYRPTVLRWLPIALETGAATDNTPQAAAAGEYIFEPSPQRVFEDLLPRWTLATFRRVMLESFTSEHSARMIAMKNATDNAEELLKSLTSQRNKIRQASITKELSEIVGTAEALK